MKRREFVTGFVGAIAWPLVAHAQNQINANQDASDQVGQVATLQGIATVTRGNAASATLKLSDAIYKKDALQTGANSSLGVTFDDETTLSLTANARIVVNDFLYEDGGKKNTAIFNIARGTVAFVASLVAKTGDMTITTPTATLGIRGTTGVIDVPDSTAAGTGEAKIKLYPDADGRVGQIDVFNRQGGRLGALTQGSSAFVIRPGPGGQFAAVPFQIPPQEAARDRGVVQRLFASHNIGRQMAIQRRQLRPPNRVRPNNLRQPGGPPQQNRGPGFQQKGNPGAPQRGGFGEKLRKLNPFAPKKKIEPTR
ncbi:MAG TPA: FecR domain-containing protein [Pseudolabrys sp.]|nr:FecR domain-containing protein [Pseudolabrys sp.]